ncbi:hypothetical protein [Comamonas terrigena]|uniref:hypothetical protein n=1 Tax=Comamonas terrigena TaxID=32013 RepID=UPI0028ACD288|nr:hypothetical protein [Comamonas terrigena]
MKTRYFRDRFGHQASTVVQLDSRRSLLISTSQWPDGVLTTTATVRTLRNGKFTLAVSTDGLGDFYKQVAVSSPGRVTAALVKAQHDSCVERLPEMHSEIAAHYNAQTTKEVHCVAGH